MTNQPQGEQYSHGYGSMNQGLARRTAQTHAQFFLPWLKQNMNLLDVGCGPGTITISFAELIAPGKVTGIDIEEAQIERAKANAEESGLSNVEFDVASAYELHFDDEHFDAVFAHTVLQHLKDPLAALIEFKRVLKPGGFVGVREEDMGGRVVWPTYPVDDLLDLYYHYWRSNGGDPHTARKHRQLLREAGFSRIEVTTAVQHFSGLEQTQEWVKPRAQHLSEPLFVDRVVELGLIERERLKAMVEDFIKWGDNPDAIIALLQCEAVAWKE